MDIAQELEHATVPVGTVPGQHIYPGLKLRQQLATFALANGLANENEALAVVAARYFRMAESERWASWFTEDGER